ncbi:MAG: ABC transporter permease [Candidatus Omnitrophota bacterium]
MKALICVMRDLKEIFNNIFSYVGGIAFLFFETLFWTITHPPLQRLNKFRFGIDKKFIEQMEHIGINSFMIVFLTALFTGMVLAFQTAYTMKKMSAQLYIAGLVSLSMCRELGPVLTALVVAARVGASIAAELGTMKVTEQIDALQTLATNPVRYLVVPRFLSLLIMLPILTIYADFIGISGGFIVAVNKLYIPSGLYLKKSFDALMYKDIWTGLIKSAVFAVIISIISCFEGMNTRGGAEGVGIATTQAVVISCILILAADCFFTTIFYFII